MDLMLIKRSQDADTRTAAGEVTKESLMSNTQSHIRDVNKGARFIAQKLLEQCAHHDHTKIEYIDVFYRDFKEARNNPDVNFKDLPWWKTHLTERHHLNDSVPEDVNLIDVMEMVIDCTMAGLARSGEVYDITIPKEVLDKAINNTKDLIVKNTEVVK